MAFRLTPNLSLEAPVTTGIERSDAGHTLGHAAVNMDKLEIFIAGVQSAATTGVNASVINTNGYRNIQCQMLSAGCISTITGALVGMPFNLVFQSVGSIGMADAGIFKLNGALNPNTNTILMLVWDGTNFIEVTRSLNG